MRILQIIETGEPGGAESIFASLSRALIDAGHTVVSVIGGDDWLAQRLSVLDCPFRIHEAKGTLDTALIRLLRSTIRDQKIDLVHAHLFGSSVYGVMATAGTGVPVIGTLHGHSDLQGEGPRLAVKRLLLRYGCNRLTAVSEHLAKHVSSSLGYPEDRIRVVYNGIDFPHPNEMPVIDRTDAHSSVRRTTGAWPIIGALGNIHASKDYSSLLRALELLVQTFPRVRLDIAGAPVNADLLETLRAEALELGITAHVNFVGFVVDTQAFLRGCDVFALSSSDEGFSLATVEAMLAGVAVVATRSGGPEEIIRQNETGLLVPAKDPHALTVAIRETLLDSGAAERRIAEAWRDARARFSMETMVRGYLDVYEEVLA